MRKWNDKVLRAWQEGCLCDAWHYLGAERQKGGVQFAVWAPHAQSVRVTGDFCGWSSEGVELQWSDGGIWTGFVSGLERDCLYKYIVRGADGVERWKADPFARYSQPRPDTASAVHTPRYRWHDADWMKKRQSLESGRNIYEVHPGSWRLKPNGDFLSWTELADQLIPYVTDLGYTHIELLPVTEHPLDASWGYQVTGFFSANSRHGKPEELMALVDRCHQAGIGVILDWVPGHFCRDAHGLGVFDGTALYEGGDHPQWGTYKFNFARWEIRSFLLSSAMYWLQEFHIDGLRVDGVSSMLYLNFGLEADSPGRRQNSRGGEEDLDAIYFLQQFNRCVGENVPGAFTIAEESSAWPLVTYPPADGGLGFHYKWDMGWMNDTLRYMQTDFPWREGSHNLLTFSMMYAFSENFVLPLSHDEVVHGKKSLIGRMPGDWWRQFAGLRLLQMYSLCHPGAKLMFMGGEFGQFIEWREYEALEWFLMEYDTHRKHHDFTRAANRLYRAEKALWEQDRGWEGFEWLDADDAPNNLLAFRRIAGDGETVLCVLNFGVQSPADYRLGVPEAGTYREIFSSDAPEFGGSGRCNPMPIRSEPIPWQGKEQSIVITVPPVGATLIKIEQEND